MESFNDQMNSIHYDSLEEILEFDTSTLCKQNKNLFAEYKRQSFGRKSVPSAPTSMDCIRLAFDGDHALYEEHSKPKMSMLDSSINPEDYLQLASAKKRVRTRASQGNELDIHSVYQGRLDKAWDATHIVENNREVRFITILADIGENWGVDALPSTWTMAVICKLADICELAGKNVQIIVGDAGRGANREKSQTTITCNIKRYQERLSPERLAAMTHLGFFRSFCFMGLATSKYACNSSLGTHLSFSDSLLPIGIREEIDQGHTKVLVVKGSLNYESAKASFRESLIKLQKIVYSE